MKGDSRKACWMSRARRLVVKVNFGWWLDLFLPCLLGLSVALSVAVLILRRGQPVSFPWILTAFVAALSAGALICFFVARRRFYRVADGLVRLESVHRLHNRLTTAEAGVGEWPEPLVRSGDGLGWRWRRFIVHPVVSAILLASAILVPIRPNDAEAARQMEEPLAWEEVEEWIETLDEEEFIEPDRLDSIREQVKELRLQPMDEWYSHSSLEASDSLRQQTEQAIRELARDITGNPVLQEVDGKREFVFQPGPIFGNLVLADEINRTARTEHGWRDLRVQRTQSGLERTPQGERRAAALDPFFGRRGFGTAR